MGTKKSKLEKKFEESKLLWYTTHKDDGWNTQWKEIALDEYGGYTEYIINIPSSSITTDANIPNKTKILLLTKDNNSTIRRKYNITKDTSRNEWFEKLKKDFAGIDANDETLSRTIVFKKINAGSPSGVLWRIDNTGITIKTNFHVVK